jgi:hypothetical protein
MQMQMHDFLTASVTVKTAGSRAPSNFFFCQDIGNITFVDQLSVTICKSLTFGICRRGMIRICVGPADCYLETLKSVRFV